MNILVLNCGSSSLKYMLIKMEQEKIIAKGIIEKIGSPASIINHTVYDNEHIKYAKEIPTHQKAINIALNNLTHKKFGVIKSKSEISAIGHRVVHGGEKFSKATIVTEEVKNDIRDCIELAPLHNPHNFRGINAAEKLFPGIPQVAVFDTAFHQTMPDYAYIYALPYSEYQNHKIRRYGFHGTSHYYVSERAAQLSNTELKNLKIISCHLGNGCSICAIKNGKSIDTSMGYTPLEGLVMGTRCGDIDPEIIIHLVSKEGFSLAEINSLLNKHSGLAGISGVSGDIREILKHAEKGNNRAKLALNIFAYRIKKYIGSYYFVLGGIDALVFTGGIGENASLIREKILEDLGFLKIILDAEKNEKAVGKEMLISSFESEVKIFCIPTNEELVIARLTREAITSESINYANLYENLIKAN